MKLADWQKQTDPKRIAFANSLHETVVMKLADWLRQTGTKRTDCARALGVSPARITQICDEKHRSLPSLTLIAAIERETHGAVTVKDFLPPQPEEE